MTSTTTLHTTVLQEIMRMRNYLGYYDHVDPAPLEAHALAALLQRTVSEVLEHANQLADNLNYNYT